MYRLKLAFIAAALFCHCLIADCIDFDKRFDTIVIGAGISGISAARELSLGGQEVLVLEASGRIGGRICSINPWGSVLELGASWIHGVNDNPIAEIAKKLNMTMVPTRYNHKCLSCQFFSMDFHDLQGKRVPEEEMFLLKKLATHFMSYLTVLSKDPANTEVSVKQALIQFEEVEKVPQALRAKLDYLVLLMIGFEEGSDIAKTSVVEIDTYSEKQAWGDDALLPQGYGTIVSYLAKGLPIVFNEEVNQIGYNEEGVQIATKSGKKLIADRAVVTVPIGVLKKEVISFIPDLPQEKKEVIKEIETGYYNKIYLFFPCVFWNPTAEWLASITPSKEPPIFFMNLAKLENQPILLGFTAGSSSKEMERWSDEETINYVMRLLKKMYGDKIPDPSAYVITRWGKYPYSYCSFTYMSQKTPRNAYEIMAKPVAGKLYFAGEAASTFEDGTVFGAFMSGRYVADLILNAPYPIKKITEVK